MSIEPSARVLAGVIGQTLEDAAFVFTEPCDSPPAFGGTVLVARMEFSGAAGPPGWELRLAASPKLGEALAADLLGEDPGDGPEEGRGADALSEMLNICCGVLARELFGPQEVCRLSVPVQATRTEEDYQREVAAACCRVSLVTEEGARLDAVLAATGVPERA
jgi:hypothetical protein